MHRRSVRRPSRLAAITLGIGLLAAACSDDSPSAETTAATVELATTTTEKAATTSSSSTSTSTSTTAGTDDSVPESATTVVTVPTYPLTGTPLVDPAAATRPAMVVKVDNHPDARPQSGLNEADIIFEENVEQLTRFALVFQSNGADPVGPIRSGRTQDVDLLGSLNAPLFVWSGGNGRVTAAIQASDLREISPQSNGPFFRTNRRAPHNLYANVSELYALASADAGPPAAQFLYRAADAEPAGEAVTGTKLSMDGVKVLWTWDDETDSFLRFSDGKVHKDTVFDAQLSTHNVVVMFVDYRPSPADGRSPEAQTEGFGMAWVYSGGKLVEGVWSRATRLDPFTLTDADGNPILLTPGRTFVELSRVDKAVTVPADTDPDDLPYP